MTAANSSDKEESKILITAVNTQRHNCKDNNNDSDVGIESEINVSDDDSDNYICNGNDDGTIDKEELWKGQETDNILNNEKNSDKNKNNDNSDSDNICVVGLRTVRACY